MSAAAVSKETRYVIGVCTWHGTVDQAGTKTFIAANGKEASVICCPVCKGDMFEPGPADEFWGTVHKFDREQPGYEAMMRWGQRRCFPDQETLENAYRQAMAAEEGS